MSLFFAAELTAVMKSVTSDVWIGLSDLGAESKFHWVDGTTMDYTNWAWGQPDGNILLPDGVSHGFVCS